MHELIRRQYTANQSDVQLCCMSAGRYVAVTTAFVDSTPEPVWVAKTSTDAAAVERFKNEAAALEFLRPWTAELNIPSLISAGCIDGEGCIIESGLGGNPRRFVLDPSKGILSDEITAAFQWLRRFQTHVQIPDAGNSGPIANDVVLKPSPAAPREAHQLAEYLKTMPFDHRLVASHGDFWGGNILYSAKGLSVIDWDAFGRRSPAQDVFTFFASCQLTTSPGIEVFTLPIFKTLFFSSEPLARLLRGLVIDFGVTGEELRYQLHLFISAMLASIDPYYRQGWIDAASWLSEHRFPGPWEMTA